jgi:hypothetical protein
LDSIIFKKEEKVHPHKDPSLKKKTMVECYYCHKRKIATWCKTKVQNKAKGTFQNFVFKDFEQANTSSTQ